MRIGRRSFPYPVLNKDKSLSGFSENSTMQLAFDTDEDGLFKIENGDVVIRNVHYSINDEELKKYIEEEKIIGKLIIECSASTFRKCYDISQEPKNISVLASELFGEVVLSCYLIANEDITTYKSNGFSPEYAEYSFEIDKYDILGVDDGIKFKIDVDVAADNKVASIFLVVPKETKDGVMTYDSGEANITIMLPKEIYGHYDNIKRKSNYNNIAFSMMAIPVLASCLEQIKQDEGWADLEDVLNEKRWFNAVCISYKRETGKELSAEQFRNCDSLELAQIVLNYGSCNGIKDFGEMIIGSEGGDDDEQD